MNKYFNKFIKINKKIISHNNSHNGYAILIDRKRYLQAFYASLATAAACNKYNLEPLVIIDNSNLGTKKVFESFGFKNFLQGFSYKYAVQNFFVSLHSLILCLLVLPKIKKNKFVWFINNFKVKKIKIGDLIYDTYVRNRKRYKNPRVDLTFLNILFKAVYRTINISNIISNYPAKFIFVSTSTYANNDAIALRIGLEKKIKVIEPTPYDFYKYDKRNITYGKYNLFSQGLKKKVLNKKININKINLFLKNRFKGKLKTIQTAPRDLKIANQNKYLVNKSKLLKKLKIDSSNIKKIILIAPHCFSDSPHGNGTFFIFRDYYQQFQETLEFIDKKSFPNILWLVRPHPSTGWFNEVGSVEELLSKYKNNKLIKLCSVKFINTSDLVEICDHVITGRGNIGLEFACKGKYSILAGAASYSGLNFTKESKSKMEYFSKLLNIQKISKLNKQQTLNAKKATYYLENNLFNPLRFSKILDHKIVREGTKAGKRGDEFIFCNKLINSLKKNSFESSRSLLQSQRIQKIESDC